MIDKEYNLTQIKLLRLMTNEIIICSVRIPENDSDNYWMIEDPFEIRSYMNGQSGDFNSTLIDWLQFSSETETKLCITDVLTCNTPEGEVLEHYMNIVRRKKINAGIHDKRESLEIVDTIKKSKDSEITFDDYIDMLNNNKVYH